MSHQSDSTGSREGAPSADQQHAQSHDSTGTTRRRLLATGAATWATVLAGCPGDGGDAEAGAAATETPTATATATETETETSTPEPQNYVVTAETGTGSEGVPEAAQFVSSCSATRRFVPGMQAIFYVGIYDPDTGNQLTDEELDAVSVNIDGAGSVELSWAGDDEENPAQEWAGSWTIPADTSPGSYSYTVEVTNGDANFRNVGILENSFEVIEYEDPTNYAVTTNTYWNGSPPEYGNGFVGGCAPERQFSQEMDVTFVVGIYESTTGELVGSDTIDSVTISSTDGAFDPVELTWQSGEAEDETAQWNGTLETENLAPGTYGYEVSVTDSGANFYNVGIATAQFSIVEI